MDSNEIVVLKNAATRMQEFLGARNIKVGHAVALEALAASLGSRNWRTLRDKLSMPNKPAVPTLDSLDGERWLVEGRYYEGSPYGHYFSGDTALDAKIYALYYRMAEDGDASFAVHSVTDRVTDEEVDWEITKISDLPKHGDLFRELLKVATLALDYRTLTAKEGQADDELKAIVKSLAEVFGEKKLYEQFNNFPQVVPSTISDATSSVGFEFDDGRFFTSEIPGVLAAISQLLQDTQVRLTDVEKRMMYQYNALLENFSDQVSAIIVTYFCVG